MHKPELPAVHWTLTSLSCGHQSTLHQQKQSLATLGWAYLSRQVSNSACLFRRQLMSQTIPVATWQDFLSEVDHSENFSSLAHKELCPTCWHQDKMNCCSPTVPTLIGMMVGKVEKIILLVGRTSRVHIVFHFSWKETSHVEQLKGND